MAGISKKRVRTKKGVETRYTITYRDVFGKQHTSGYYETQKEAKKDLWKFDEIKANNSIKYGYIFQEFLKKVKEKNAKSTYDNYNRYYEMYLKRYDDIDYDKINSLYWQREFDNICKNSPYVAIITLKMAKAAVNRLIKHELLTKNVFNKIEILKPPKPDINHLTVDEIKRILQECKKSYPKYYALLYTFIGTGAREGEIFALTKDDFNPKLKKIRINKQYTKGKLYNHPKTASSNREIFIFDDLNEILKEHVKTNDFNLLFPNKNGGYIDISNFRERFWVKLLELCNITKRVRIHDIRGSYVDMGFTSGLSVKFIQNQLGHSKAETTTNIYAQNNDDMVLLAQFRFNQIFTNFEKCEINVSLKENLSDKKIIPFRKKQTGISF